MLKIGSDYERCDKILLAHQFGTLLYAFEYGFCRGYNEHIHHEICPNYQPVLKLRPMLLGRALCKYLTSFVRKFTV